jgi:hypothetical protein
MLVSLVWALFAGLRMDIGGGDYFSYRQFYQSLAGFKGVAASGWEPLFRYLAGFASLVGLSYHGFLSVVALLGIVPAVYVIDRRAGDSPMALFVYGIEFMYYGSFVILRQGVAIGLAFLVLDAMMDRKPFRALAYCALAVGFHYSALALLFFVLFSSRMHPRLRTVLYSMAALCGAGLIIMAYGGTLPRQYYLLDRLVHYFAGGYAERVNPLNFVELLLVAFVFRRYVRNADPIVDNAFFFTIIFMNLGMVSSIIVRIASYFKIVVPIILGAAVTSDTQPGFMARHFGKAWLELAIFLYYFAKIFRWLLLNAGGPGGFLPYRTILGW